MKLFNIFPWRYFHFSFEYVAVGEDVADAVYYFFAHARNTTGAELVLDGGNTIQLYPIIPKE